MKNDQKAAAMAPSFKEKGDMTTKLLWIVYHDDKPNFLRYLF